MTDKGHDTHSSGSRALGKIDKMFTTASPARMMVTCGHHIWMALEKGAEVRNARTAELVHEWNKDASKENTSSNVWSLLALTTRTKGPQVWMGLSNGSVEVYDAQDFSMVRQLSKHTGGVYCLAEFGGYAYSGSSDFKIAQWDVEDGRHVRMLHGHTNSVRCLYAEGSAVVSGSDDCTVRVWNAGSGEEQLAGHFHGRVCVSALCRVGITMWSGDDEGRVVAWRLSTCEALRVLQAHGGRVASLQKIGSRVYSGGADGVIAVFDAEDGRLLQRIEDHRGARIATVQCALECGRHSVWTAASDNLVRCWHHDEEWAMTLERERVNDMRWYYATVRSHHETNERLLRQQRELTELVTMSQGGEGAVRHTLNISGEIKSSALLSCWMLQKNMREVEERTRELQNERSQIQSAIQKQEQNLEVMRGLLQKTLEAVQRARATSKREDVSGVVNVEGVAPVAMSAVPVPVPGPSVTFPAVSIPVAPQ